MNFMWSELDKLSANSARDTCYTQHFVIVLHGFVIVGINIRQPYRGLSFIIMENASDVGPIIACRVYQAVVHNDNLCEP